MRRTLCLLPLLLLGACASQPSVAHGPVPALEQAMPLNPPAGSDMLAVNTHAGDALAAILLQHTGSGSPILSSSFVAMDNLDATSTFGRMTGQQVASRLGQQGFRVLDSKLGMDLRVDGNGEFMLTRDCARLLAHEHDAWAALVGVYAVADDKVFVSARVVRLADTAIVAAYEYYVPLSDALGLLPGSTAGGTSGGDSFWRRYAVRPRTGSGAVTAVPVAPGSVPRVVAVQPVSGSAAAVISAGGRPVDPSEPPTPFPGKRR